MKHVLISSTRLEGEKTRQVVTGKVVLEDDRLDYYGNGEIVKSLRIFQSGSTSEEKLDDISGWSNGYISISDVKSGRGPKFPIERSRRDHADRFVAHKGDYQVERS